MSGKVHQRNGICIRTFYICPPIPMRQFDYCAVDDEHYDGAPDSKTKDEVGFGATEDEAIEKLLMIAFQPPDDEWRIVEVPNYPRGAFGIETNSPEAIEKNEEIILYPCLTREAAECIVRAHNEGK